MAYSSRPVVSMSHPDRWLAFVRIIVGLYFAKAVYTKIGLVMLGSLILFVLFNDPMKMIRRNRALSQQRKSTPAAVTPADTSATSTGSAGSGH